MKRPPPSLKTAGYGPACWMPRAARNSRLKLRPTTAPTDADLAIAKSDSPDPVYAGSNVRYTIVVTNNGPDDVTGAHVTDIVPPEFAPS